MRIVCFVAALIAALVFSIPVWASLPYYNSDIGYTIWLPKGWSEVSECDLKSVEQAGTPFPVRGMMPDWQAGYCSPAEGGVHSLLVEVQPGRKMHAADISNFNRFIVESISRSGQAQWQLPDTPRLTLKDATYIQEKKTLRLESEVVHRGETMLSLTYIVYTRKGMLTFVGYVDPGDAQARKSIDKAVLSLYLDDNIRY
ncbi:MULTISPECIES: hypothetical protein [unclassified Pseudodesulfovibrio]|uniref:hypothetical protein n=1 Tax=unclassified Pseudodesulfovibrio TaxID=2661612 RepID=UPI000FEBF892|nr:MULTISPECIES: hypothetical protein [unclassified Pseudodesulfovibrio]MCJ2164455.1 hypothetical protein [Pseudodesulfovibrio sp. S3-i]RWU04657.1 hypothetical protein DWB63_07850 [Pseudodesulfovibrio sp. S3]